MPGLAINAAEQMARLIRVVRGPAQAGAGRRARRQAPVEPPQARSPSINLNSIHAGQALGGWQTPAVPDRCTAIFDRRFIHEESFDEVRAEIVRLLDAQGHRLRAARPDARRPAARRPDGVLAQHDGRGHSRRAGRRAAASSPARARTTRSTSFVARASTSASRYGPGRLVLAHQPDEYVAIADLVASARVMALLVLRLLV